METKIASQPASTAHVEEGRLAVRSASVGDVSVSVWGHKNPIALDPVSRQTRASNAHCKMDSKWDVNAESEGRRLAPKESNWNLPGTEHAPAK